MLMNKPIPIDEIRMKTLGSYSKGKWPGSHSPVVLAGQGFSYTGTDEIIECSECKVSIDLAAEELVTLQTHDKTCKIGQHLRGVVTLSEQSNPSTNYSGVVNSRLNGNGQRNIVNTRNQFMVHVYDSYDQLPQAVKNDLNMYKSFDMIKNAPSEYCFCSKCKGYAYYCKILRNRDMFGFPIFSNKTLILKMKMKLESAFMYPEFANENARRRSLDSKKEIAGGNIPQLVEAGFFYNGVNDICCFCCGLGLREEFLCNDSWREHCRWCPVCPFVLKNKTEKYVHDVIIETNILKDYLQDQHCCSQMYTADVEEALKRYPQAIIQSTIQGYFLENGGFPRRDDLLSALDAITRWKTDLIIPKKDRPGGSA